MADNLGFVPSTPAKDDLGFIPHPIATKGNDNLGFIPSPTYKVPASTIQPGPGAIPLSVNQDPASYTQAGPATRNPAEEAERPKGSGDWLMDAITAPGTFIGSLFHPHVPTKEELSQERVTGAPAQVNLPLIDPSVGMDPTFMKGIVKGIGGLTTPSQLPLTLFSPESKALSGLFAAMTVPQLGIKATEYQELKAAGKDAEANVVLGEMATMGAFGTLAAYHTAGGGERLSTLDKGEQAYLTDVLKEHYTKSLKEELKGGQPKLSEVPQGAAESEGLPPRQQPSPLNQGPTPPLTQEGGVEALRDDTGASRGEGPSQTDTLQRAQQERAGGPPAEGPTYAVSGPREQQEQDALVRRLMIEETIKDDKRAIASTTDPAEKARITEHMNDFKDMLIEPGSEAEGDMLERKVKGLSTLLPDFTKAIGGGEEKAARPDSAVAGATGILGSNEPPPPVISPAVDDDLAAGGIHVQHKGQDINLGIRVLGSLIEKVRALKRDGHPLGDILYSFTSKGSDAIKAIMRNTGDSVKSFINGSYKLVNDVEWSNQVVNIMNNGITERPADIPDHVWAAAQHAQTMVEAERIKTRDAKRAELHIMKPNLPMVSDDPNAASITKFYPDDWGLKGRYYPHAHPGTWAISQLTGVDERGDNIWEPIDDENTSWRAVSEFAAKDVAEGWLRTHPDATIRVKQDTISASASSLTDRARLRSLVDRVGEATETIAHGGDPDDVMDQLYNQTSAAAYGPRYAAKRQWGSAMRRETDLQGFSRDIEDFKDHLVAGERYAVLAPVRQEMMKIRNQVAKLAGAGQVQSPSDFPTFKFPPQYANILGRMDSFIEGLEGTPGLADATMKYLLNSVGADPNLANKVMGPIQQLWALMKLGFNPARLLSHGSQSIWAVNTVLGTDATIKGYAHSYDPAYDWLVHDLAIEHAGNMSDIDGFREYAGAYFGRGSTPIDWTKGGLKTIRDLGMAPLMGGVHFSGRVAAIGAYIQGIERGMESPQAREYARDVLDRTMGVYHAADNPALFRQLPSTVTQFKGFMAKTGQFIFGLRGAEIPRFLAAAVLIGGVTAAGIAQLSSLIHLATGGESIADYLKRKYPTYARGIFGLIGLDVPSAVGPGDFSLYKTNAPFGGIAGPLWSDIITAGKAGIEQLQDPVRRSASQDLDAATRVLSPQGRRIWDEGTRIASTPSSVDPRTGSVILEHLTPLERLEEVLGFTPLRVAEERESHEYVRNLIANEKDKRGFFVDHMAANAIKLSQPGLTHEQQMDVMKDTIALGRMAAEYGVGAGLPKAVVERAREMQLERLHRDFKLAPRAVRPQIYEEMQRFQEEQK